MAETGHQNHADLLERLWNTVTQAEGSGEKGKAQTSAWAWSWFCWAWGCCAWPACGPSRCLTTATRTAGRTRTCTWENTPNTNTWGKSGQVWGWYRLFYFISCADLLVLFFSRYSNRCSEIMMSWGLYLFIYFTKMTEVSLWREWRGSVKMSFPFMVLISVLCSDCFCSLYLLISPQMRRVRRTYGTLHGVAQEHAC